MPTLGLYGTGTTQQQGRQTPQAPQAPSYGPTGGPLQTPGNNLINKSYTEQGLEYTQNRLLNDPAQQQLANQAQAAGTAQKGENYMNANLASLDGPGIGDQYWSQVGGQYTSPFSGEQFARQATQDFNASGPSSAFYNSQAGNVGQYTNYSGPGNAQGQYGTSSAQLAGGTQGEAGLGQLAGQYGAIGQYGGPNLAAGQYQQTQGAFGDMPIANFDPFYDRARQLATQDYNRQSAGRGVYGSSEALSGVGNVITDIEAQRANRSFDAEMQRAQEQRMRQQLLGEQARMGDLSGTDAFKANLQGVQTFGDINKAQGELELGRHQTLGTMANQADTQALGAQQANIAGLSAFGDIANNADRNETDRYTATTSAMNAADRTGLERLNSGADIAFRSDENRRADFDSASRNAESAARLGLDRAKTSADIYDMASDNDLQRLGGFMESAGMADTMHHDRQKTRLDQVSAMQQDMNRTIGAAMDAYNRGDQAAWENQFNSSIAPYLQQAGYSQQQQQQMMQNPLLLAQVLGNLNLGGGGGGATGGGGGSTTQTAAPPKRSLEPNPY